MCIINGTKTTVRLFIGHYLIDSHVRLQFDTLAPVQAGRRGLSLARAQAQAGYQGMETGRVLKPGVMTRTFEFVNIKRVARGRPLKYTKSLLFSFNSITLCFLFYYLL